jgi:hypothetical protein
MKRRAVLWICALITLVVLTVALFVGGGLYETYGRWSAKRAVTRALDGFSRGAVPDDIDLELEKLDPEQEAEALRAGFEVDVADNIPLSYRSFEMAVRVANGSNLWCDLYHASQWQLKCWRVI